MLLYNYGVLLLIKIKFVKRLIFTVAIKSAMFKVMGEGSNKYRVNACFATLIRITVPKPDKRRGIIPAYSPVIPSSWLMSKIDRNTLL